MKFDMISEDPQRTADEAGHSIGVTASTPAFDQITEPGNSRDTAVEGRGTERQLLHDEVEPGQAINTRTTLSGSLAFEVGNHPTDLGQRTNS
jgi:hypothetical protein